MLIETLFLRLFEPDQSEIKGVFQEIVNTHNGTIFKNGTAPLSRCLQTAKKEFVIQLLILCDSSRPIV